jgi:hypothetical protein
VTAIPAANVEEYKGGTPRHAVARLLRVLIEGGLLALVCLSPWAFGAVDPVYEAALYAGLVLLALLWAARLLVEGRLVLRRCPLLLCLAGLFLLAAVQLAPLPESVLSRLSPGTAELYARLLPAQPEELPEGSTAAPAGRPLSLYAGATRRQALQLLAVLLLLALTATNIPAGPGLRRLAVAALVNGALLALFALLQEWTAAPGTIYWSVETTGPAFGPFATRDGFAAYLNLCIGLGLGLLLSYTAVAREEGSSWLARGRMLRTWRAPAIGAALALQLGAIAFCGSRAGIAAVLAAAAVAVLLQLALWRWQAFFLIWAAAVLAGAGWLAWSANEAALRWAQDLPVWGTGYGTYSLVDPKQRGPNLDAMHAPDSYAEALIEGGVARLGLSLLAIVIVYRRGWLACRLLAGQPEGALAVGAIAAFTTVVIQCAAAGVLHIPAVALLTTVVCANLSGLGSRPAQVERPANEAAAQPVRAAWPKALAGAVLLLTLTAVVAVEGVWKLFWSDRLARAAERLDDATDLADRRRQIAFLGAAARLAPGDARLQMELARARVRLRSAQRERIAEQFAATEAAQLLLAVAPSGAQPALVAPPFWVLDPDGWERLVNDTERRQTREQVAAVLRQLLSARDSCPLWAEAHLRIAENRDRFRLADSRAAYSQRAKFLAAASADVWYRCGIQELADGEPDLAWQSWRRCLELSSLYLGGILDRSSDSLGPHEILNRVLPDRPEVLAEAADYLLPQRQSAAERRPFLERALRVLRQGAGPSTAEEFHLEAVLCRSLARPAEAVAALEVALERQPMRADWRCELAEMLAEQGRSAAARRQLETVIEHQPDNSRARRLLEYLARSPANKQ